MMEMNHQRCEQLIEREFVRGGLSSEQSDAMRQHVRGCDTCGRVYARYADAEAALFPRGGSGGLTPTQLDRVSDRLFARRSPSRRRPWAWAGVGAFATAAVATLVLTVGPDPSAQDGLRSRQGGAPVVDAAVGLRALRLRPSADGLDVTDLGTSGRARPGDQIAIVYAHRGGFSSLHVQRVDPAGKTHVVGAITALEAGAVDERIAVVSVNADWPSGTHVFEARFDADGATPVVRHVAVEVAPF